MLTKKDYCDYETCVALKELGYVGSSRYYYTQRDRKFHYDAYNKFYTVRTADAMGYVLAIHLYDAQKWLREEKGKHIEINLQFLSEEKRWYWGFTILYFDNPHLVSINGDYSSYEETLSEGIKEAVKILKNNGKAN